MIANADPTQTLVKRREFERVLAVSFRGVPVRLGTTAFVQHAASGFASGVRRGAEMVAGLRPGLTLGDGFVRAVLGSRRTTDPVPDLGEKVDAVYRGVGRDRHSLLRAEAELVGLARRAFLQQFVRGQAAAFDAASGGRLMARPLVSRSAVGACPGCSLIRGPVPVANAVLLVGRVPRCRCCLLPAVPPGVRVWEAVPTGNVFCATGVGGGVDPTCGAGKGNPARGAISKGEAAATAAALDAVDRPALLKARRKARAKFAAARVPSGEEARAAQAKMALLGADRYEANIRGTTVDRANSRKKLLAEFGDGKTCPCVYCGLRLDDGSVTRDKLYTAAEGGRYRHENLVPACLACNKRRSDTPFTAITWK